jgi:hypothetical protein
MNEEKRKPKRRHIVTRILSIFLFAALVNFIGFLTWVYLKPRSIPYLSVQVEAAFEASGSGYKATVGNTVLQWDGWREPVGIHLYSFRIAEAAGKEVASFPDVKISLKLTRLLFGDITLKDARLIGPSLRIKVAPSEKLETTEAAPSSYVQMQTSVAELVKTAAVVLRQVPVQNIGFERARLIIDNGTQENVWEIPKANIAITPEKDGVDILANIDVDFWGEKVKLEAEGGVYETSESTLRFRVKDFIAEMMSDIIPAEKWIRKLGANFSGEVVLNLHPAEGIKKASLDMRMDSDVMRFFAQGSIQNHKNYKNNAAVPELKAHVELANMPYDQLKRFWPPGVGVDPREWMLASLSGGTIKSAKADIHMRPDDFLAPLPDKSAVDAEVVFSGIRVMYLETLPVVENAEGVAKFDGNSMTLNATGGTMPSSRVVNTTVRIYHIGRGDEEIEIDGVTEGGVADLLPFFMLQKATSKKPLEVAGMTGTHQTDYHFKFPLLKDLLVSQINYYATSKMQNITIPAVNKGVDLTDGSLTLSVDNVNLSVGGDAKLGGVPIALNYYEQSGEKAEFDSRYDVRFKADGTEMAAMGMPLAQYVKSGKVDAKAILTNKGEHTLIQVEADATLAQISVPEIGFEKPVGEDAAIFFKGDETATALQIEEAMLTGKFIKLKVKGEIDTASSFPRSLDISEAKFGRNDFSANLSTAEANKYRLLVMGKSLNLGPAIEHYMAQTDSKPREFGVLVESKLEQLALAGGNILKNVNGFIDCGIKVCSSAAISGTWEDGSGTASLDYKKENGERVMELKSDNAGALLAGLAFTNHIREGKLETTARTDDKNEAALSKGKFNMKDFRVVKAPVLAQLLSVGSLTGMADLLGGQGIVFDKADGEYTYDGKVLSIQGLKAAGNAIGLTAEGETNTHTGQVLLRGDVVPAFMVNRMLGNVLGNVPVVGTIVTGGGGQGVVATRYKLSGTFEKPEIQVNPLSMLTPGFLRNVWGLPEDTKLPEEKAVPQKPADKKPAEEKPKEKVGKKAE